MIKISIYKNEEDEITGFQMMGHAGYAEHGQDIICAAVSALVINAINSIEKFTDDVFTIDENETDGFLEFHITSQISDETNLLMNSLLLGLSGIQSSYGKKYIRFTIE